MKEKLKNKRDKRYNKKINGINQELIKRLRNIYK